MLQIGRKPGESVVIGDSLRVIVLDVKGKTARLGFEFLEDGFEEGHDKNGHDKIGVKPSIHREEIYKRIQKENKDAAESTHLLKWLKKRHKQHE